jgi:hypothetical protein
LAAGARRAFLARPDAELDVVELAEAGALLVETNRRWGRALFLALLAGREGSWKRSMWERVAEADALVLTGGVKVMDLPDGLRGKPAFSLAVGEWVTPELLRFVGERLFSRP